MGDDRFLRALSDRSRRAIKAGDRDDVRTKAKLEVHARSLSCYFVVDLEPEERVPHAGCGGEEHRVGVRACRSSGALQDCLFCQGELLRKGVEERGRSLLL